MSSEIKFHKHTADEQRMLDALNSGEPAVCLTTARLEEMLAKAVVAGMFYQRDDGRLSLRNTAGQACAMTSFGVDTLTLAAEIMRREGIAK